jgi:phosphoribosylanthranilate isomerase
MIVKICGIKTFEIAIHALEAGADMLGFNFYLPSSRYIQPDTCADIITRLKSLGKNFTAVGVFVNENSQKIQEIMGTCQLDLAQFAGDETPQDIDMLDGKAFKAVRPRSRMEAEEQIQLFARPKAPALLVDAHVKGAYGGTGETGDWSLACQVAERAPILLAGGLNPENVAAAVQAVRPWGVDVASGVESSPGIKDPEKICAFIAAARSFNHKL